jgi:UDP-N-acetylglucosamine 2-epimerase
MKIVSVVGARPQFVKAAVLSRRLRERHDEVLVHTGQHYDDLMSEVFFRTLDLPAPDANLGVGSGSHATQTARMLEALEPVLQAQQPDLVLVYGDTNSTLAGALTAAKLNLPVAHVEAGFRSNNRAMPEEINRVLTDHVSRYLFCVTAASAECLRSEGLSRGVHQVGDLMYDSLLALLPAAREVEPQVLARYEIRPGEYYLSTIHRPANTDEPDRMRAIFQGFARLGLPVVLPLHPRTRAALAEASIELPSNVRASEPVGYFEMLALERGAKAVLSDSGGVRREAYFLAVPSVTLRGDTEWPETLASGWDVLADADPDRIVEAAQRPRPETAPPPIFGDGNAAGRIIEVLDRDPPHG